jgi:hypothetical protein
VTPDDTPAPLDVLYPVRPGESNEELRYSLRSLTANLPHGRVWLIGHRPTWVTGVGFIEGGNAQKNAHANVYNNLLLACQHPDLPDEFVVFNDDFFVTAPVPRVYVLYRGTMADHLRKWPRGRAGYGWWQESLLATNISLQAVGIENPLSYELHVPFPVNKHAMAETLEQFRRVTPHNPPQWRTLYGNMHSIGGALHPDGKALRPGTLSRPYHSTDDSSWRYFRNSVMALFPKPCGYEGEVIPPRSARSLTSVRSRYELMAAHPRRTRA